MEDVDECVTESRKAEVELSMGITNRLGFILNDRHMVDCSVKLFSFHYRSLKKLNCSLLTGSVLVVELVKVCRQTTREI